MGIQKKWIRRRDFAKYGLGGLAIATLNSIPAAADSKNRTPQTKKETGIIRRTLGRTGLNTPVISLGCGFVDEPGLVRAALDAGITHFDTAPGYGGGRSEPVLGEVLKSVKREKFILSSKIGLPVDNRTGKFRENIDKPAFQKYFRSQLEERLTLLQTDHLDILYVYDAQTPELLAHPLVRELLLEARKSGKTRFLGASFHQNEPAMIQACIDQKIFDVVLTAYNFRQPHRHLVGQAIDRAAKAGLGVVAMKFFAGVYWDRERRQPINARAALKWLIQDKNVHTVAVGMKSFDQVDQNVSVMGDPALTPQEIKDLRLDEPPAMGGLYCAQCRRCLNQCPQGLDIPRAMRAYMYAYGYRASALAKNTLMMPENNWVLCRDCDICSVSCTQGFDVGNRLKDITRLLDIPDEFLI